MLTDGGKTMAIGDDFGNLPALLNHERHGNQRVMVEARRFIGIS